MNRLGAAKRAGRLDEELERYSEEGYRPGDWIGKTGLERIYDPLLHGQDGGFLMEALMAGIAQGEPDAKARVRAFLEGRAAKVTRPT